MKTLVEWIHVSDLEDADPIQVRQMVQDARDDIDEDDPRDPVLEDIENALWGGTVPADSLRQFARDWGDWTPDGAELEEPLLPYGEALEDEFRQVAAGLATEEWHTTFYDEALGAVDQAEAGDTDGFLEVLEKMRTRLVEAWVPYAESPVMDEEVTAETVVGHRLLQEGIEGWLHALDQLEQAQAGEMSFDDALATGEAANRLLVSTQRLARRVAEEARAAG